jgi:hypothetical protein
MAGYPRETGKDKGFWDGGPSSHGSNKESGGRSSGAPGQRTPTKTGFRVDLEFPMKSESEEPKR